MATRLTPARVRFRPPTGTRMCSHEQERFFRNYLPERFIPHLHVCEIQLHTLLIHCRDVNTFVETQVPNAGCAFQTRRVLCATRHLSLCSPNR